MSFIFFIVHIDDSPNSSKRYCKNDSEYSTKRGTNNHNNKNKKRRKIKRATHNIWNKNVILNLLYDEIEDSYGKCNFPRYSESDDERWYEC